VNAHDPSEGAGAWIGEEDASSRDRIRAQLALTPRQRLAGIRRAYILYRHGQQQRGRAVIGDPRGDPAAC